jgi:hypothetical protein
MSVDTPRTSLVWLQFVWRYRETSRLWCVMTCTDVSMNSRCFVASYLMVQEINGADICSWLADDHFSFSVMNTIPFNVIEIPFFLSFHFLPYPIVCYGLHLWSVMLLLTCIYIYFFVAFTLPDSFYFYIFRSTLCVSFPVWFLRPKTSLIFPLNKISTLIIFCSLPSGSVQR